MLENPIWDHVDSLGHSHHHYYHVACFIDISMGHKIGGWHGIRHVKIVPVYMSVHLQMHYHI